MGDSLFTISIQCADDHCVTSTIGPATASGSSINIDYPAATVTAVASEYPYVPVSAAIISDIIESSLAVPVSPSDLTVVMPSGSPVAPVVPGTVQTTSVGGYGSGYGHGAGSIGVTTIVEPVPNKPIPTAAPFNSVSWSSLAPGLSIAYTEASGPSAGSATSVVSISTPIPEIPIDLPVPSEAFMPATTYEIDEEYTSSIARSTTSAQPTPAECEGDCGPSSVAPSAKIEEPGVVQEPEVPLPSTTIYTQSPAYQSACVGEECNIPTELPQFEGGASSINGAAGFTASIMSVLVVLFAIF